ncbi:hypothetical protein AX16_003527 [Volvariella volvacea WC 439]|nr:hypothetical protein AX16_003527 [Volvariella volvacea WC 439]
MTSNSIHLAIQFMLLFSTSTIALVEAASYKLVKDYSGPTFFADWTFYDHFDNLTNDNTSVVPFNEKRNTVRITTNDQYGVGSVWVADLFHVPYGCSVWPAWWSQAPTWPAGGEIDTFEGVNLGTLNQMSLHTLPGCNLVDPVQTSPFVNSTNCDSQANNNQGCIVTDPDPASFGAGFAAAGGGVFVTEYAESGISIWFFPRANVPSELSGNGSILDTSALGKATANWPSGGCNIDQFFSAQHLIFDITLCGDFAKPPSIFLQTCTGVCYNDYVVGNGSVYSTAYFDIGSVRVFNTSGLPDHSSNNSPSSPSNNPPNDPSNNHSDSLTNSNPGKSISLTSACPAADIDVYRLWIAMAALLIALATSML